MKDVFSLPETLTRAATKRADVTSVEILTGPDHLGMWDRAYWRMRLQADHVFYLQSLHDLLNKATVHNHRVVARDIDRFLAIPEVRLGLTSANSHSLKMLSMRVEKILDPQAQEPAVRYSKLRA